MHAMSPIAFVTRMLSFIVGRRIAAAAALLFVIFLSPLGAHADDWPEWRGPARSGVSQERQLPDRWSPQGENLAWRVPYGSRSAPIVFNGRIYLFTSAGADADRQERLVCLDEETGKLLWERRHNLYLSDTPPHRVAWASPAADPETGNIYAYGGGASLFAYTRDGKLLWTRSLAEDFGVITTHGGRTVSPIVEGNLVIISGLMSGWGSLARGGNRYFAFDKTTGQAIWITSPQARHYDTNYSSPIAATVNGTRMLFVGGTDGTIHALKLATGEPVWKFEMTKRAINTNVVMAGTTAIVTHSEENLDTQDMGLIAAIDAATATGTVTKAQLKWAATGWQGGFSTPVIDEAAGRIYQVDNGAVLAAFDLASGKKLWDRNLGTIQKGSSLLADGKLYVGTENGKLWILKPGAEGVEVVDEDALLPQGRTEAEAIIASPIAANGRIYLTSMDALYAIGPKAIASRRPRASRRGPAAAPGTTAGSNGESAAGAGAATWIQVTPFDSTLKPGDTLKLSARFFDAQGHVVATQPVTWTLEGLGGGVSADGTYTPDAASGTAGLVKATAGALSGTARVRVLGPPPIDINFDNATGEAPPAAWVNATSKFVVKDLEGNKVLTRVEDNTLTRRARMLFGASDLHDYTVEMDVRVTERRRQQGDVGVIAQRYTLVIFGNSQKIELQHWQPATAMSASAPFAWKAETWYHVKMMAENQKGGATRVRAKVWPRGEAEPAAWTVEKVDPIGHTQGSPGLYADAPYGAYYDNIRVTSNSPSRSRADER